MKPSPARCRSEVMAACGGRPKGKVFMPGSLARNSLFKYPVRLSDRGSNGDSEELELSSTKERLSLPLYEAFAVEVADLPSNFKNNTPYQIKIAWTPFIICYWFPSEKKIAEVRK